MRDLTFVKVDFAIKDSWCKEAQKYERSLERETGMSWDKNGLFIYSGKEKVKEVHAKENKRRKDDRGECKRGREWGVCSQGKGREERRGEAKVGISLL